MTNGCMIVVVDVARTQIEDWRALSTISVLCGA